MVIIFLWSRDASLSLKKTHSYITAIAHVLIRIDRIDVLLKDTSTGYSLKHYPVTTKPKIIL